MNEKLLNYLFLDRFFLIAFNLEEQKNPYSCFPFNTGCKFITHKIFVFEFLHHLKQIIANFISIKCDFKNCIGLG